MIIRKFYELSGDGSGHIDSEKAKEYIKEKTQGIVGDTAKEKVDPEFNLPEDNTLGQDPGDTLQGHIIATKYGEEIIDKVVDFRVRIDSLFLTMKIFSDGDLILKGRECALSVTAFQSARQFTGIILHERGAKYPYNGTGTVERPNQGQIIQTDGYLPFAEAEEDRKIAIKNLATLREVAESVIIDFEIFAKNVATTSFKETVAFHEVMAGLISGKMWLGELMAVLAGK